jgi:hypothetical protein
MKASIVALGVSWQQNHINIIRWKAKSEYSLAKSQSIHVALTTIIIKMAKNV